MRLAPASAWVGKPRALARLETGVRNSAPTPLSIMGANLVGWWNADSASKITTTGQGVSSWLDEIGGYDLSQATDARRPVWSATSFGGRGGVAFDSVDDFLRLGSTPAAFPIGAAYSEIWVVADQVRAAGVAGSLCSFGYGNGATNTRIVRRVVASAVNRAGLSVEGVTANNVNVDYSGRHYVRGIFLNGAVNANVDGVAGSDGAAALATTAANVTMGGSTSGASSAAFFEGVIHQVLVLDATPSAAQITALNAYFASRI